MNEIDQAKVSDIEERNRKNEARALGALAYIMSGMPYTISEPRPPPRSTKVEEKDRTTHYGTCPHCGSYLHKKGSRVICKKCGHKERR
jgi:DNA-directed RNA polymerase subunit RPC12/RpoP